MDTCACVTQSLRCSPETVNNVVNRLYYKTNIKILFKQKKIHSSQLLGCAIFFSVDTSMGALNLILQMGRQKHRDFKSLVQLIQPADDGWRFKPRAHKPLGDTCFYKNKNTWFPKDLEGDGGKHTE